MIAQPYHRSPLRLVPKLQGHSQTFEHHVALALRLTGICEDGEDLQLRQSALLTLIEGLSAQESIEFIVAFDSSGKTLKSLDVRLSRQLGGLVSETAQILPTALGAALPRWKLSEVTCPDRQPLPTVRAMMYPVPIQVQSMQFPDIKGPAPWPGRLPSWMLTTPMEEPLMLGAWALAFKFSARSLTQRQRSDLQLYWRELQRGTLRLLNPLQLNEPYMHDTGLGAAAISHWHELLRQEKGWHFAVAIHAENEPSKFMLTRLQRDIFGVHPVKLHQSFVQSNFETDVAFPLLAVQGLPGVIPDKTCLVAAGVPSIPREPDHLPEGPGLLIGNTTSGAEVLLPAKFLCQHTLVVGGSGAGKSNLLRQLAMAQMRAGGGVAFLDPHGLDFDALLASVPASRKKDVVVIDLNLADYSVALNPMEGTLHDLQRRSLVAQRLTDMIDVQIEVKESSGPKTRQVTRDILELAMHHPKGGNLADAERIVFDAEFRAYLLSKVTAPRLKDSWSGFIRSTGNDSSFENWMTYIHARFQPFTSSLSMNATLNRASTVDIRDLLRKRAIILIKLPQSGMSQSDVRLLGTLILDQFQMAAIEGGTHRMHQPYLLVVDEFASFATPAASGMFAQLRKYGIALCVATQSVANLRSRSEEIATAVLGNSAAKLFFRLAPAEAIRLDEYTAPEYPARVVARLPNYQAILSLAPAGIPPLRFITSRAVSDSTSQSARRLRNASGKRHGTPVEEAIRILEARHPQFGKLQ